MLHIQNYSVDCLLVYSHTVYHKSDNSASTDKWLKEKEKARKKERQKEWRKKEHKKNDNTHKIHS